jgi:hypothetical protein
VSHSYWQRGIREIPVAALLGEVLEKEEQNRALPHFYHYFDLSNEQAYLHRRNRVRSQTWNEWRDGIIQNLQRPAFSAAWDDVSSRAPESFNDLREALKQPPATSDSVIRQITKSGSEPTSRIPKEFRAPPDELVGEPGAFEPRQVQP